MYLTATCTLVKPVWGFDFGFQALGTQTNDFGGFGWNIKKQGINFPLFKQLNKLAVEELPLVRFLRIHVGHEYDTYLGASSPEQLLNKFIANILFT